MTIILTFTVVSFAASVLVISTCALSSRLSQQEGVKEIYADLAQSDVSNAKPATPFSLN
jgi:hypothetical protein